MLKSLFKPEYLFKPSVLLRRLLRLPSKFNSDFADYMLPWGLTIRIRPKEEHGRMLLTLGVIDLVVSEFLWRLSEAGDIQVDVGGNIGYMTSILCTRTHLRDGGRVITFEANPEVYDEMAFNISRWREVFPNMEIQTLNMAASNKTGLLQLEMPDNFSNNRGLSRIVASGSGVRTVEVAAQTLDSTIGEQHIGVLKLDVEGHELQVLEGSRRLFSDRRVRDCIFEEHQEYPTPVTDWFESHGYKVIRLHRSLLGPKLLDGNSQIRRTSWHPTNFLATLDEERAMRLTKPRGWDVLRTSHLPLANSIT